MENILPVTSGIHQGSILGPVIFRIFINDLPDVLSYLVKFYADDAKVYSPIKVVKDEMRLPNHCLSFNF